MDLTALETMLDHDPLAFAEEVFRAVDWFGTMRLLATRPGWATRAWRALVALGVSACVSEMTPEPRCVAEMLLWEVGRAQLPEAFDAIVRIAREHPQRELRIYAMHSLGEYGARGQDAIASSEGGGDRFDAEQDSVARGLIVSAALCRGDSFERLTEGSAEKRAILLDLLARGPEHRDAASGARRTEHPWFVNDAPWVAWCVLCLGDRASSRAAQHALMAVPKARWKPLADAMKRKQRSASTRGSDVDAKLQATLDAELREVRAALEQLVARLRREKYAFVAGKRALVAPSSPSAYSKKLRALEKLTGTVPLALARFWAVVGSVDLRGTHPAWTRPAWLGKGVKEPLLLSDPLVVASLADALDCARDEAPDKDARSAGATYEIDISADATGKAGYSGGLLSVTCPAIEADPRLGGADTTFMEYVRGAVRAGGFPGLAR
ncbi:MAG: hypothetical protein WCJ30_07165 [Deltaproteobacteria bacterium]